MADKILTLIDKPVLRVGMGTKGRERFMDKFTAETMVRKTEELYEKYLN